MAGGLKHIGACPGESSTAFAIKTQGATPEEALERIGRLFPGAQVQAGVCESGGDTYLLIDHTSLYPDRGRLMGENAVLQITLAKHEVEKARLEADIVRARKNLAEIERESGSSDSSAKRIALSALWASVSFGVVTELFLDVATWLGTRRGIERTALFRIKRFEQMRALQARENLCGPLLTPAGRPHWLDLLMKEIPGPLAVGALTAAGIAVEEVLRGRSRHSAFEQLRDDPAVKRKMEERTATDVELPWASDAMRLDVRGLLAERERLTEGALRLSKQVESLGVELQRINLLAIVKGYQKLNPSDLGNLSDREMIAVVERMQELGESERGSALGKLGEWWQEMVGIGLGFGVGTAYARLRWEMTRFSRGMRALRGRIDALAAESAQGEIARMKAAGTLVPCGAQAQKQTGEAPAAERAHASTVADDLDAFTLQAMGGERSFPIMPPAELLSGLLLGGILEALGLGAGAAGGVPAGVALAGGML